MQQNQGGYAVQGVKSFIGREGHGFNATLTHDGRKIAFVRDMANGGMFDFEWLAKTPAAQVADAEALHAFVSTLPQVNLGDLYKNGVDVMADQDEDGFLARLVGEAEDRARLRRWLSAQLKKRVLFVKDGKLKQLTAPLTPALLAKAKEVHADCQFLNGLALDDALALYLSTEEPQA